VTVSRRLLRGEALYEDDDEDDDEDDREGDREGAGA
jgi:hypothetical protein